MFNYMLLYVILWLPLLMHASASVGVRVGTMYIQCTVPV